MTASKGRISGRVKLLYGIGLSAEGIKTNAFNVFLLFYYQQIQGLEPTLCGLALFLSLCVDALVDPAIGAWSDSFRSRIGRRHPFMYAGALPLPLCFWAVFNPPHGLGRFALFSWLLAFAVGTRCSMALFVIPHQSLVPELAADTAERTSLMSLRTVFAWLFGLTNGFVGYVVFLHPTPKYPTGLLNAEGYRPFSTFGAVVMLVAMLVSALGTQRAALSLQQPARPATHASLRDLPRAMFLALENRSFRAIVVAGLFASVGYGLSENLSNYMNTFFWGFTSAEVGSFIGVIFLASLAVLLIARPLVQRFETRSIVLVTSTVTMVATPLLVGLRLLGVLPDRGTDALFRVLAAAVFVIYSSIILGMTMTGTMIASVTDEHELTTGTRQEGLLFAAAMFISKAASGLGVMAAGVVVKLARFPENASPASVDPSAVRNLGIGAAAAAFLFSAGALFNLRRFSLDAARHGTIMSALSSDRAASAALAQGHAGKELEP